MFVLFWWLTYCADLYSSDANLEQDFIWYRF
jgi:hypothetical protein